METTAKTKMDANMSRLSTKIITHYGAHCRAEMQTHFTQSNATNKNRAHCLRELRNREHFTAAAVCVGPTRSAMTSCAAQYLSLFLDPAASTS